MGNAMKSDDLSEIEELLEEVSNIDCSNDFVDAMGQEVSSKVDDLRSLAYRMVTLLKMINSPKGPLDGCHICGAHDGENCDGGLHG